MTERYLINLTDAELADRKAKIEAMIADTNKSFDSNDVVSIGVQAGRFVNVTRYDAAKNWQKSALRQTQEEIDIRAANTA